MKGIISLWSTKGNFSKEKEFEYYEQSAEDRRALSFEHLDRYVKVLGLDFFEGRNVLDLGCGEGVYSAWIADRGRAAHVVGLDLTEHRIRTEYAERLPNLEFVCGDLFAADLGGKRFDIVFMNLVLHHLRFDLPGAVESVWKHLRPGGAFVAFEPNVYSPMAVAAHLLHERSANEGFLSPFKVKETLVTRGFTSVNSGFFWRDRWWAKNPMLASSFWIKAEKPE